MSLANAERTGWRDQALSSRHRRWGFHCPGVDLDFVLVEYALGQPAALVEYKHHESGPVDLTHPSYRALKELADRSCVPFIVARYWPEVWCFDVLPVNRVACTSVTAGLMSERDYVGCLHQLRGRVIQDQVLRHLRSEVVVEGRR